MDMLLPLAGLLFFFLMLSLVVTVTGFSASHEAEKGVNEELTGRSQP